MKTGIAILLAAAVHAAGEVKIDADFFGRSLGEWNPGESTTVDYRLSGSEYRTYKPEITPTPEGGIYASVRIDYLRGWLSSDDHAVLEITVSPVGIISAAKSTVAIQGRSISSDVIFGANEAGKVITGADRAVQVGTDLIADLTSKLLREKIVEAGRVSFPSALRHNYNLLYQAIRLDGRPVPPLAPVIPSEQGQPATPPASTPPASTPPASTPPASTPPAESAPPVAKPVPGNAGLEVIPYGGAPAADLPVGE
ncbi:MAG: hypothetical protein V4733_10335 [Verrucomicrobiota bacterium]